MMKVAVVPLCYHQNLGNFYHLAYLFAREIYCHPPTIWATAALSVLSVIFSIFIWPLPSAGVAVAAILPVTRFEFRHWPRAQTVLIGLWVVGVLLPPWRLMVIFPRVRVFLYLIVVALVRTGAAYVLECFSVRHCRERFQTARFE